MNLLILSVVALFGGAIGQTTRNPNPCLGVPGTNLFRRDFSNCATYYWCNNGVAVHTVPCPAGYGFDEVKQLCTVATAADCLACPAIIDIAVCQIMKYFYDSYEYLGPN